MKLVKPDWIEHEGGAIYSLDIHPDGSRLATGGAGKGCGEICIWNMTPLRMEEEEKNEACDRLLCKMTNHSDSVNCVRWSASGNYLASCSLGIVIIWHKSSVESSTIFGGGRNIENWTCSHMLHSHKEDVLDLAWNTDDSMLATAGIDGVILVWNAKCFPEIISTITDHQGSVKGLTWDPIGKYLASQSIDKSLRVWRTIDWKQEVAITKPYLKCNFVLRCSWSPDGQCLVSSHADNNAAPVAKIIERRGWKVDKDFVGHEKAVCAVKFNPTLFHENVPTASKFDVSFAICCYCALGSRDCSISVWSTALQRPVVVVNNLFDSTVADLTWNSSGNELLACSLDGSVAYFSFSETELGKSLTENERVIKLID
ncbi:uncharacterized protein TRIADDRAFT_32472 [Trichoplax adhaerens]|uniref:CAF1B/HIR1 beta-propeller domain-containing protein n=1 Tax=Trichoplax adhaerens TaxID=10228 RepID=B3SAM0_TRIAD|nr:hypothetical protein TRIADDRAFT_32472 [Trichoplax adhaerens]EDV20126.1 hypothetical protein TRIADDRAFT_32472 [Trichoplax adhaerens]|eukprot:XP_002117287.1 hypothetical protein TRIADDRAFT_32472 [Trichoplax adhaerens]